MDYSNFTIIAQKALKTASKIAKDERFIAIENAHLLEGIIETDKNVAPFLLKRLNVNIETFGKEVDKLAASYPRGPEGAKLEVSDKVEISLNHAKLFTKQMNDEFISVEHILLGMLQAGDLTTELLVQFGITQTGMLQAIEELRKGVKVHKTPASAFEALNKFAVNLNEQIKAGKLDPVVGRSAEIRKVLQIVSRRRKNNPVIIGEPGVGKTAIVEGLAQRIVRGDVPDNLKDCQVYSLDMAAIIAGASKQGEFESRIKSVIEEVIRSSGTVILFIDEIHLLVTTGKGGGGIDAANLLKPALARGELRAIGATTINEYQQSFEKDKALARRFQPVMVEEPEIEDAVSILRGIKEKYESHHQVRIKDEALIAAVELSHRYVTERCLPDKAVDLIDEAAAKLRMEINSLPEEIDKLERVLVQIKIEKEALLREGDDKKAEQLRERIGNLNDERSRLRAIWESERELVTKILAKRDEVIQLKQQADNAERDAQYDLVAEIRYGKIKAAETELAQLAEELRQKQGETTLFNAEVDSNYVAEIVAEWTGIPVAKMRQSEREKLLHLEAELGKRIIGQRDAVKAVSAAVRRSRAGLHDANKPIGSFIFLGTTGVGKTELAKTLAAFLFDDENAMVRIDMSEYQEKHAVARLIGSPPGYVGYDEGGQLTEAVRRKPYSVVLFDEVEKANRDIFNTLLQVLDDGRLTDSKGRTVNFKNTIIIMTSNAGADKIAELFAKITPENRVQTIQQAKEEVSKVLRENMAPEFLNRIDEIVMFTPLTYNEIRQIVDLQTASVKRKLADSGVRINITPLASQWLARVGYNPQFGARPVKRTIQRYIMDELSNKILAGEIAQDKIVNIDYAEGRLVFSNVNEADIEALNKRTLDDDKLKLSDEVNKEKESENTQKDTKTDTNIAITDAKAVKRGFWQRIGDFFRNLFGSDAPKTNQ